MRANILLRAGRVWTAISIALLIGAVTGTVALAHEGREVGEYGMVVGFFEEPAYEGQPNSVDLRVHIDVNDEDQPVEGVEATLKVEVTHLATGVKKEFDLRTVFGTSGRYLADFIPTQPGQYRFRFFGKIGDQDVDETFESGPGTFGNVVPLADAQFPEAVPTGRELQSAVRGVQADVQSASDRAFSARLLGIVGLVLGAVGAVAGGAALVRSFPRQGRS